MILRVFLIGALALTGCVGARHTIDPASEAERLAWANRLFSERPAVVVLTDGTAYDAQALRLATDITTWVDPASRQLLAIPTSAIAVVERRDKTRAMERAARRGAGGGAITLGLLGAAAGYESGGCFLFCDGSPTRSERAGALVLWGAGGAMTGAVYGLFVGTVAGIFSSPTEQVVLAPSATVGAPLVRVEADANGEEAPNRAP